MPNGRYHVITPSPLAQPSQVWAMTAHRAPSRGRSRIEAKRPRYVDQGFATSQPPQRFLAPMLIKLPGASKMHPTGLASCRRRRARRGCLIYWVGNGPSGPVDHNRRNRSKITQARPVFRGGKQGAPILWGWGVEMFGDGRWQPIAPSIVPLCDAEY